MDRRRAWSEFRVCIIFMVLAGCSPRGAEGDSARQPVFIMITRGIVGGIYVPPMGSSSPLVSHICYLDSGMQDPVAVRSYYEQSGYSRYDSCDLHREQLLTLLQSLDDLDLWRLPVGDSGSVADIYGRGIRLSVRSGSRIWRNRVPGGCTIIPSRIHPGDSERHRFEAVIGRIDSMFGAASCTTEVDKYAFGEVMFRGDEFASQREFFRPPLNRRKRMDAQDTLHP